MKAVIVCGSRRARTEDWHDAVYAVLSGVPKPPYEDDLVLIHGDCDGIDRLAAAIVREWSWGVLPMPAPWKRMGTGAGPFRNMQMLTVLMALGHCGYEIAVLAFHNDLIGGSRGTKNMVARAKLAGVPYAVYDHTGHAYLESAGGDA